MNSRDFNSDFGCSWINAEWDVDREGDGLWQSGHVHLWSASLDSASTALLDIERSLSNDERVRAARFRFLIDRRRFIASRGLLRLLAGGYLGCAPSTVEFSYGPFGKPYLAHSTGRSVVSFNLSHSGAVTVLAFRRGPDVGVDVEQLDWSFDVKEVADRSFTENESAVLMSLSPQQRQVRFFDFWTCKEAIAKALGRGLSLPFHEFDVSATVDAADGVGQLWIDPAKIYCSIHRFAPAPGYVGALASIGAGVRVLRRQLRYVCRERLAYSEWLTEPSGSA